MKKIFVLIVMQLILLSFSSCLQVASPLPQPTDETNERMTSLITPFGVFSLKFINQPDPVCLNRLNGFKLISYNKESYDDGYDERLTYIFESSNYDDSKMNEIKDHYEFQLNQCGYKKSSSEESTSSFPGLKIFKEYSLYFEKGYSYVDLKIAAFSIKSKTYYIVDVENYVINSSNDETEDKESSNFESSEDQISEKIPFTDFGKTWNNLLKSKLKPVFGDLKLTELEENEIESMRSLVFDYKLSKEITSENIAKLKNLIKELNFSQIHVDSFGDEYIITGYKDNYDYITFDAYLGSFYLKVELSSIKSGE